MPQGRFQQAGNKISAGAQGFARGYSNSVRPPAINPGGIGFDLRSPQQRTQIANRGRASRALATVGKIGATPMLAADTVRSAGSDTDIEAYMKLATAMGWPTDIIDERGQRTKNFPSPMALKNARRQLTNRDLLWMGLNGMQDAITSKLGPLSPIVNTAIDSSLAFEPVSKFVNTGINKLYDAKFKDENKTGREPGIADLFGFIAKHMTQPGEFQGFMNMIGNQPLPEYLQHPNTLGIRPTVTAVDLLQNLLMPHGQVATGLGQLGGAVSDIGQPNNFGGKVTPESVARYFGNAIKNDTTHFMRKNVGGVAKEIGRNTPRSVKNAIRTFGASENSFIP